MLLLVDIIFHLDLELRGNPVSEDNEIQPSYLHIWRQAILELGDPLSALKLLLVSSFSPLCKLYLSFLLFQRNLCYGKWLGFWQVLKEVSLTASRPSIILELISKPLIIFRAGPWNGSVGMNVNNCWMYCSFIFFCLCEDSLWLLDVFTFILFFSAHCSSAKACIFRTKASTASTVIVQFIAIINSFDW